MYERPDDVFITERETEQDSENSRNLVDTAVGIGFGTLETEK